MNLRTKKRRIHVYNEKGFHIGAIPGEGDVSPCFIGNSCGINKAIDI